MSAGRAEAIAVTFWGVRGSIPVPGPDTVIYGGNTACISLKLDRQYLILDAGSGIRRFGQSLLTRGKVTGNQIAVFISHTHWDHIQGIPFFASAFIKGNRIRVFGPKLFNQSLEKILSTQMEHTYFPVRLQALDADITFTELGIGRHEQLLENVTVETCVTNHPVIDMGYKFTIGGKRIAYLTDYELFTDAYFDHVAQTVKPNLLKIGRELLRHLRREYLRFISGVDLLITDSFSTRAEYPAKAGWGHSVYDDVYAAARSAKVKRLCFFHHDPNRGDADLAAIERQFQRRNRQEHAFTAVFAAREGLTLTL